jgi:integrase
MSGSLRQRSPGSWELKFESSSDPATSKRKTVYRTVRGTKREAQAKLVELQSEAARGGLVDFTRETLGQFMSRWMRDWATHNASPKTRERWGQLIDNQITPRLGGASLQRIKPAHLAELYAALAREGAVGGKSLAPRTVHHVHGFCIGRSGSLSPGSLSTKTRPPASARPRSRTKRLRFPPRRK